MCVFPLVLPIPIPTQILAMGTVTVMATGMVTAMGRVMIHGHSPGMVVAELRQLVPAILSCAVRLGFNGEYSATQSEIAKLLVDHVSLYPYAPERTATRWNTINC
ncbi:MAG: hypothetical protein LBV45_06025 [Xanthomonadaceae bacterium]|nr:hypothetical protein [Xanthomonadaceae bacterium]